MTPCQIFLTEECINSEYLPDYMKGCRRFRIEYREPSSGYSNFEGTVYVANTKDIFDITDEIEDILRKSFQIERNVWRSSTEDGVSQNTTP